MKLNPILVLQLFCLILRESVNARESYTSNQKLTQHRERVRFESLLASGRPLSFPFSAGFILAVVSSQHENWNVSLKGLEGIIRLSPNEIQEAYVVAANSIRKNSKSNFGSSFYLLPYWKGGLGESSNASLERFTILPKKVEWNEENWNTTWALMNQEINGRTNNLLNEKLIPQNTAAGNPFRFTTQAVLTTAFHYRNEWQNPWFQVDSKGSHKGVKYLQTQGEFGFAETEEYTAIRVPLREAEKSVMFILPKVDLKQFLKTGVERLTLRKYEEEEDVVPFPVRWEAKNLSILIPTMRLTHYDQYGRNFPEFGMNQTFCTTLRDKEGKHPFFLRPVAQVNAINLNKDFFEVASASGTAIEKFFFGLDLAGIGFPKGANLDLPQDRTAAEAEATQENKARESETPELISGMHEELRTDSEIGIGTTESEPETTVQADYETELVFNKPFLFYLYDETMGPLYYGIKEDFGTSPSSFENLEETNSPLMEEATRYLMWSCKSFKNPEKLQRQMVKS